MINTSMPIHAVRKSKKKKEKKKQKNTADQKRQILYEYHDVPKGGHHTLSRIKLTHNWRGITKDVEEYIGNVNSAKKAKSENKNTLDNHEYPNETT